MISIFEFGYRYLIPSIKRRLVEKLIDIGLTQKEVARKLGLSVSAVSRYLSMKRGATIDLASYSDLDEAISKLAIDIRDNRIDFHDIHLWIYRIAFYALSRRYMCRWHAKIDLNINPDLCFICPKLIGSLTDSSLLAR